jgi:hypothetical protein
VKILSSILLAASLLAGSSAFAQGAKEVADARAASEHWMQLMDSEEYSAAWNSSSEGIRKEMPNMAWNLLASATHLPLGTLKSRRFKMAGVKQVAPGKGETITFEYEADYEKNHHVREAITTVHEADGVWRVSGYTINDDKR